MPGALGPTCMRACVHACVCFCSCVRVWLAQKEAARVEAEEDERMLQALIAERDGPKRVIVCDLR